jgi:hypothetical protein
LLDDTPVTPHDLCRGMDPHTHTVTIRERRPEVRFSRMHRVHRFKVPIPGYRAQVGRKSGVERSTGAREHGSTDAAGARHGPEARDATRAGAERNEAGARGHAQQRHVGGGVHVRHRVGCVELRPAKRHLFPAHTRRFRAQRACSSSVQRVSVPLVQSHRRLHSPSPRPHLDTSDQIEVQGTLIAD